MSLANKKSTELAYETSEREKNIQKMKFCIISTHKSQLYRNSLLMFTLDNKM